MASRTLPQSVIAAPIDIISEDLLQNIVARLPATSFASATCVSRSWNVVCDRVLSRPMLASACSFNPSLQIAVEEVVNKVLSEPIRPHFAIASIGGSFDLDDDEEDVLEEAHYLITEALGSDIPVITNSPLGIVGRDVFSDEIKEIQCNHVDCWISTRAESRSNPTFKEPEMVTVDKFITDIREFSTSVSGSKSPAAIVVFPDYEPCMIDVMEKMDYAMSPETVIVGDNFSRFRCTSGSRSAAVALVFAVDKNKPPGIAETQFHAVLSSGLSPVGPTYKATSVMDEENSTRIAARREMSHENIDGATILNQVYAELGLGGRTRSRNLYVGVTKKRKCSIGQENVGCMTSFAFHKVCGNYQEYFYVSEEGIKTGDTFRFCHPNSTAALSSAGAVSSHMRSLNKTTTGGDRQEVFGSIMFTCCGELFFGQPNIDSSLFLDNFPGVTLGGGILLQQRDWTLCISPIC